MRPCRNADKFFPALPRGWQLKSIGNKDERSHGMPVFTFTGTDPQGKKVAGERLADSKAAVTMQLRRERITPGAIKEKGKEFALPKIGAAKVATKDIAVFFRQFSVMIDAGLPLVQCLEI